MKELAIASNMITMARNAKSLEQKRSLMLRMILPLLSTATADKLAKTITNHNSREFAQIWEQVKPEIAGKIAGDRAQQSAKPLPPQMVGTASMGDITREEWEVMHPEPKTVVQTAETEPAYADVTTFQRDGETCVAITTYGPRKIRIALNGTTVLEAQPNAEGRVLPHNNNCGGVPIAGSGINVNQVCQLVKLVCERLLMKADPCPLGPNGAQCDSNLIELHDKLLASTI